MSWITSFLAEHQLAIWTILAGAITNAACAMLGCFLVLRRMSLLGDAISHGILPGIVVAFLFTGRIDSPVMFAGAVVVGVLTAFLTQTLNAFGNVPEDVSMGVVFTSLFALGVFLLSNLARNVDLDPGCLLYGLIEFIPLDVQSVGAFETFKPMVLSLAATLAFVVLFWKELKLASFDPALATAMGLSAVLVHYLLMAMVAVVTVAAFEVVGSILVVAMLIVPAATAQLLSDRLRGMLIWSVVVGVMSSILGYLWAEPLNTSVAGMMAVAAGAQFALAVVFAPRHGLLGKAWGNLSLSLRIVGEDIVALLYRSEELAPQAPTRPRLDRRACLRAVGGGPLAWLAIPRLRRRGEVTVASGGELHLTDAGRRLAQSLVRSHRLWEAFLGEHFHLPLDHLHAPAERIEHFIGPRLQERLAAELRTPIQDPHGRDIPPPAEEQKAAGGRQ